nr:MBL fold metallo-hydrolase [Paenibacillus shirakamiensis]
MLGTGSAFAKTYFNNNALLHQGDFTLMIDCGITAPLALHQLGYAWEDIDAVLITHLHADHVGGLEEFAFQMKYRYHRKPVLYIAEPLATPLWEHTLSGGLSQDEIRVLDDAFEVRKITEGTIVTLTENLDVELIQTPHIEGKLSYSLYINGGIFYSADLRFQPDLLHKLVNERSCHTILHEVQLTGEGFVHTTLNELLTLPVALQQQISLMHYGDEKEDFVGKTGPMQFLQQHQLYEL